MAINNNKQGFVILIIAVISGLIICSLLINGTLSGLETIFLIADVMVLLVAVWDLMVILKNVRLAGKLLYQTKIKYQTLVNITTIFILVATLVDVIHVIIKNEDYPWISLPTWLFMMTIMMCTRMAIKSGVYETGIITYGAYFTWDKIKEFSLEANNEVRFLLLPQKEYIMTNYTAKLFYKPETETEIKAYLERKFQQGEQNER